MHRDPSNAGRRFIPLLLADCDLPDPFRRYKYVDFREEVAVAFAPPPPSSSASKRPSGNEVMRVHPLGMVQYPASK